MSLEKKIYLVGGAVRDKLMGIPINDKDYVAVGYKAEDFSHLHKVGKDFPVFLQEDGSELALARVEKKIATGYNGFSTDIDNVTIEEDLLRRDLTINSIAYDEDLDKYIDPYNGISDIKNKILRHTSNAFREDPLRVLRLARFRAKFGKEWSIDFATQKLILSMKDELHYLQPDRVYKEIIKAISYKDFHLFFETLCELGVIDNLFPTISQLAKDKKIFTLTMELLHILNENSTSLKISALYYYLYENNSFTIDINLPKKMAEYIQALLTKHRLFTNIEMLNNKQIEELFSSFRRDKKLLNDILYFNTLLLQVEHKYNHCTTKKLNSDVIMEICNEISRYSPKLWIESLSTKPSNQKISSHIQNYNLQVISRYKRLYKKPFIL